MMRSGFQRLLQSSGRRRLSTSKQRPSLLYSPFFFLTQTQAPPPPPGSSGGGDRNKQLAQLGLSTALVLGMAYMLRKDSGGGVGSQDPREITWVTFRSKVLPSGEVIKLEVVNGTQVRVFAKGGPPTGPAYVFSIASLETFERQLDEAQYDLGVRLLDSVPVLYVHDVNYLWEAVKILGPTLLVIGALTWVQRQVGRAGGPGGGGIFGVGRSKAKLVNKETGLTTTFKDVAGLHEAKQEVMEFVEFLKNPKKYQALGARIPKGALLVGPPGTGKTLLAKATAGEAGVAFFSISGSDFMEMFVGVGPARVRDLFKQARESAPAIVWIDEIDAVGRARSTGAGGHDERENTLNQLLVEMDGFETLKGVVVLAGTNRADVLDKALLRPGRFDRQITVDLPDMLGRRDIFAVHLRPLKLAQPPVSPERLATLTVGMSGADIANVCNEAALIAARAGKEAVDTAEFEAAIERIVGGLEKKNKVVPPAERAKIAYHEAGHALVGWFLEHTEPLLKVSIVPRGTSALGYAQYLPRERFLYTSEQLQDRMCMTLGGRVAEQLKFGVMSTGAQDDLQKITRQVYAQITRYGMNEKLGMAAYNLDDSSGNYQRPYSEKTASLIDSEARRMVGEAYRRTEELLRGKMAQLEALATQLLEKEVLKTDDLVALLGERPFGTRGSHDDLAQQMLREAEERLAKDTNRKD